MPCPPLTADVVRACCHNLSRLQAIDVVISGVSQMAAEIADLEWPIFAEERDSDWKRITGKFDTSLVEMQKAAEEVINACFR